MNTSAFRARRGLAAIVLSLAAAIAPSALAHHAPAADDEARNAQTIRHAFDAWAAGTGGPYELLHEQARWTIVGRSAAAGTYAGREAFMREVIRPFNARMLKPLKPVIRHVYTSGDVVIVLFDARGTARDGLTYENTYTWYLTLRDGRITDATAFFDSIAFDELWSRVPPAPSAP